MFLFTIDFLKNAVVFIPLSFIIYIVVKRNLKIASQNVISIESEESCIPEILYFESMSTEDKLKKIDNELRKIEKYLTPEKVLNVSHKCLTEIQLLKLKICKSYQFEQVELDNAISWLEKPAETRGKYRTVAREEDKIESHEIDDVKRVIKRLIAKRASDGVSMIDAAENSADTDDVAEVENKYETDGDNVTPQNSSSEAIERETVKIPDVNLEKILEVRNMFDRLLPIAKTWSLKLFDDMLATIKMVYVTLMLIRRSIFNQNSWTNTINPAASKLSKKLIFIQTNVNDDDGVTSIDVSLLPTLLGSSLPQVQRAGPTGYFARFTAAAKRMAGRLFGIQS
ncbi:uncharacterized protein LOC100575759 [Acyrthosiphon pisum]|uniref:Uncharacterized protein n=1 Tax=Acyrthosiphon pisum TaxID=7029 RepID=A0A8R1W7A9_ACYPI|nr:uncharacterized protein LOC100575759 [Acyrthosiphon pisum]|eukprot:XP_003242423.1 PREDICTED: uncharacterized protein LOC100575759 [Acyrthosiphon pisum]